MGRFRHILKISTAWLWKKAKDDRGNIAVIFAITLPMIVGGLGYGVETTYWYVTRLGMQNAADTAAFAAAIEARSGSNYDGIKGAAVTSAAENGFPASGGIAVNTPPTQGEGGSDAVEVILTRSLDRVFTSLFNDGTIDLSVRAVATYNTASTACILALHPTDGATAMFSGSTTVNLVGCSVMANSVADDAVKVQGSAKLNVNCVISAGGVSATSGLTMTECDSPVTEAPPVGDPFRKTAAPALTGPCMNDNGAHLTPGRFCNGMNLKNNVNLAPGVYVIEGGDFRVNANANITGSGVTIYLASGSHVNFNGNAEIKLSAPTSGPYSGMLMFGSRTGTGTNIVNGTAASQLTGALYFKSQKVQYNGNFSGANGCTQVVAASIEWTGNSTIKADCSSLGMNSIPAMTVVKLTE